jgi:hypothetical protein
MDKKIIKTPKPGGCPEKGFHWAYLSVQEMWVLKRNPKKRDKEERSDEQKDAVIRFTAISRMCKRNFPYLIKPIWGKIYRDNCTSTNLFKKINNNAFDSKGNLVDPKLIQVSIGDIPMPSDMSVELKAKTDKEVEYISVKWNESPNDQSRKKKTDKLAYCFLRDDIALVPIYTEVYKEQYYDNIILDRKINKGEYLYVFFISKDGNEFSNSQVFQF